jgi:hypothetical protein
MKPALPTHPETAAQMLWGIDFSSAPSARKPIVLAQGLLVGAVLRLQGLQRLNTLTQFEDWLRTPGPWVGGFDFPFGLPRGFVDSLGLGQSSFEVMAAIRQRCATRMDFRALVDQWGNGQPKGQRLLHRRTDAAQVGVSSTSPLQTRYVPVGFMYFEGFSRLLQAQVRVPQMFDPPGTVSQRAQARVALEAYPGLLAHELIGRRSYKNDPGAERLLARKQMVEMLEQGRTRLGLRLKLSPSQAGQLVADATGDHLDAVLCLVQAAWASQQPVYGLPADMDGVEGWIISS